MNESAPESGCSADEHQSSPSAATQVLVSESNWDVRLVKFLIDRRHGLLVVAILLTVLAYPVSVQLQLNRSIESLFAEDDQLLRDYLDSKATFGGDAFVIVAWQEQDPLLSETLTQIEDFGQRLSEIPGVRPESTQTLAGLLRPKNMGFLGSMFLRIPTVRRTALEFAEGALIGADQKTTAIVLRLEEQAETTAPRSETYAAIRQLAREHLPPAYVVGEPIQVHDMFNVVEQDGAKLGWVSSLILLTVIFLFFRSLRWMILPILIVQLALIWTKAFLVLTGLKLSMVSSMLNSLVTIIGIATVMHITVLFRELRGQLDRKLALKQTLLTLLSPIMWACVTTAIGFGALLSSEIVPIRSFGLMMVLGIIATFLVVCFVIPGGVLLGQFSIDPLRYRWEQKLIQVLQRLLSLVLSHPLPIAVLTVLLIIFGSVGLSRLKIETDFSRNFRESSLIVQALNFTEANLGGAGTYDVNFHCESLDEENLDKLRQLADELRELTVQAQPAVTKVVALTDGLDFVPSLGGRTVSAKRATLRKMQPEFEPSLYHETTQRMRIVLRAFERQPAELKLEMIEAVERTARQYFPDARCTGLYLLLANIIQSLLSDQVISLTLAACGIFLCMSLVFRSWKIGLLALIPNLFPILILIGTLGWIGSLVNIGTAMIASVSIGLTVDSSIHYLTDYYRQRRAGYAHDEALQLTQARVGVTLVFTNIALVCGFSVLTLSEFVPLIYFGVLVSIAMLGGLFGNLVLLPLLITGIHGRDLNRG